MSKYHLTFDERNYHSESDSDFEPDDEELRNSKPIINAQRGKENRHKRAAALRAEERIRAKIEAERQQEMQSTISSVSTAIRSIPQPLPSGQRPKPRKPTKH
jgi:phosphotransacetylase